VSGDIIDFLAERSSAPAGGLMGAVKAGLRSADVFPDIPGTGDTPRILRRRCAGDAAP
jgi:hypothetical protein